MNYRCGIYCIENMINHKKYIGLSQNIPYRWTTHEYALNKNIHINKHLQSAWNKYGTENFYFYIIENCNIDELQEREIYYISKYKSNDRKYGYNKTSGGDGVKELSEESRDMISLHETLYAVLQFDLNGNFINLHRNCSFAAKSVNASTPENIRSCCLKLRGYKTAYGYIWRYEKDGYDFDISEYMHKKLYKAITQYNLDGEKVSDYESAIMAEQITGINHKTISAVCCGDKNTAGGFIWRLKDEPFDKFPVYKGYTSVDQLDLDGVYITTYKTITEAEKAIHAHGIYGVLNGKHKTCGGYKWCKHVA